MNFQFDADVRRPDGGKLGELRRVIFNPDTREVAALVITHNTVEGREVVVPLEAVQTSDDQAIALLVTEEQFDQFEDFIVDTRNIAPPPNAESIDSDLIDDPVDVPDVLPIGAATGIESIAYTPLVEEDINLPVGDQLLDTHTIVWATDGELGHLIQVVSDDETRRITALIVERGFFFKHDTEVPFEVVGNIQLDTVILTVPRSELGVKND